MESKEIDEEGNSLLTYICHDKTFKKVDIDDELILQHPTTEQFVDQEITYKVKEIIDEFDGILTLKIQEEWREEEAKEISSYNYCSGYVNPRPVYLTGVSLSPFNALKNICLDFIETGKLPELTKQLLNTQPKTDFGTVEKIQDPFEKIFEISKNMEYTFLPIQGPPGTGKSTILGEVIAKLAKANFKVAIASNSYAAVLNLVKKVIPHLDDEVVTFLDLKEGSIKDEILQIQEINIPKKDDDSVGEKIVATTTNKICHQRYWDENKFDYLIIDEVGQVPMVTTIATTLSTKNLILIGDPNQLPQVKKGTQPNKNNLSTFEYLINEKNVIDKEKGIFLDTTFRLHPEINEFISNYFYNNSLHFDKKNELRYLSHEDKSLKETGIQFIEVDHTGNILASSEEIKEIKNLIDKLLNSSFVNEGIKRKITKDDILIIAPYNLQVYELRKKLGNNFKIGTIDKFQGQEAPIVIVSFAASSSEDAPRGIEFILNFNRMNVAISRAQCLTLIVGSPHLTNLFYQNVNSIKLTNLHRVLMDSN